MLVALGTCREGRRQPCSSAQKPALAPEANALLPHPYLPSFPAAWLSMTLGGAAAGPARLAARPGAA